MDGMAVGDLTCARNSVLGSCSFPGHPLMDNLVQHATAFGLQNGLGVDTREQINQESD
ncbi:MAG TPA: hypothetical protein VKH62_11610 [Candidatus Binatia bacterium]|nr:hypothetical protein [Candidatus Binatia bacterium]